VCTIYITLERSCFAASAVKISADAELLAQAYTVHIYMGGDGGGDNPSVVA